jgi:hypothetical protein
MPSGSYRQVYVQCPFYKYDDGSKRITCEGLIEESSLALIYRRKADFETQIKQFCSCHYKCCEIYGILMKKYEEDNCDT